MGYEAIISKHLDKLFSKLSKKDKLQFEILTRKINSILENPHQFKPLRGGMKNTRRVHIGKSFVLVTK